MSDGSLSQDKINALLYGSNKIKGENGIYEQIAAIKKGESTALNLRFVRDFLDIRAFNNLLSGILSLTNLQKLYLRFNQLTSLPPEISNLTNLQLLDLNYTQLTSLPPEISNLTNLQKLYLSSNQLTSLPPEISNLTNLQGLDLSSNQLTSLPPEISNLTNLQRLDLCDNQFTSLPREILTLSLPFCWNYGDSINGIYIKGNPLTNPPVEIAQQGDKAIRNYFTKLKQEETIRLYEAKLILIGEGEVGKTSVIKRVMEPHLSISKKEKTTEGIDIRKWIFPTKQTNEFQVNVWDFGGQEIYHATHQFFLTKRSLYLLVWDARKDYDVVSFDYWLNVVGLLSDASPVIVVLNKIDERIKNIDEQSLKEKYPNIICFERVSAWTGDGIQELTRKIKTVLTKLRHIGDTLPKAWVTMKRFFEEVRKTHNFMNYREYLYLCLKKLNLDTEQAGFIGNYLHDLGFFLHFRDNAILKDIVFLKPEWATNAVYRILDTKEVLLNKGIFYFKDLEIYWPEYPPEKYIHLVELMKKFELCFKIPGKEAYIVPELLPIKRPAIKWKYEKCLCCEYHYEFMPSGIITRFIVRTQDLNKKRIYWKNGAILVYANTLAMIVSEAINKKIILWIQGDEKKELLAIIRREIGHIHATLNNPKVKIMVPCICPDCYQQKEPF
ncbi:MAG: leucine-rich repeat domain-containing protein, partial [Spirochaetales bacterium]|nr:leucine-rich repeat domain-containing protein [Spirochaetales bacterium]